jgi:hypothetical protein
MFGVYWGLIRAGSGIIRRETLVAVGRRAEQASRMLSQNRDKPD